MRNLIVIGLLSVSLGLTAQGRGQGAIVLRDNAPVYNDDSGKETLLTLNRGDAVAGYILSSALFGGGNPWRFNEKNGRTRVWFLVKGKMSARMGWMAVEDLAKFTYDGGCGRNAAPSDTVGLKVVWNTCFEEARDAKLDALREKWAHEPPSTAVSTPSSAPANTPTSAPATAPKAATVPAEAPATPDAPPAQPTTAAKP